MSNPMPQDSPLESATIALWQLAQDARSHIALGNFGEADTTIDRLRHLNLNTIPGPKGAQIRAKRAAQVENLICDLATALGKTVVTEGQKA